MGPHFAAEGKQHCQWGRYATVASMHRVLQTIVVPLMLVQTRQYAVQEVKCTFMDSGTTVQSVKDGHAGRTRCVNLGLFAREMVVELKRVFAVQREHPMAISLMITTISAEVESAVALGIIPGTVVRLRGCVGWIPRRVMNAKGTPIMVLVLGITVRLQGNKPRS